MPPLTGQMATFGTGAGRKENYALVLSDAAPTATAILMNRPPAAAVANNFS